jgi:hypothetical protein
MQLINVSLKIDCKGNVDWRKLIKSRIIFVKMIIALDLDDTLAKSIDGFLEFYNHKYNPKLSLEEADVEIENITSLGYQEVSEIKEGLKGDEFYQLRFYATIKRIKKQTIDPATGKIPIRKFILPSEFSTYCPWGKIGQCIVDKAERIFKQKEEENKSLL